MKVLQNTANVNDSAIVTYMAFPLTAFHRYSSHVYFFLGVLGNAFVVILILWRGLNSKSSIFTFFLFMSLLDIVKVACSAGMLFFQEFLFTRALSPEQSDSIEGWAIIIGNYIGDSGMIASMWIVVIANAYKFCLMLEPPLVKTLIKKYAVSISMGIIIMFYTVNSIMLYTCVITGSALGNETIYIADVGVRENFKVFMFAYFFPFLVLMYTIAPNILLVALSVGILLLFWTNRRKHRSSTDQNSVAPTLEIIPALLPLTAYHLLLSLPGIRYPLVVPTYDVNRIHQTVNHSLRVYLQLGFCKYYRDALLAR